LLVEFGAAANAIYAKQWSKEPSLAFEKGAFLFANG